MDDASPWDGLAFDEARRVDRSGKRDYFWAVVEYDAPALVLFLEPDTEQILPLPIIRSLDINYRTVGSRPAFVVALREPAQADIFETLCRDIVTAGEAGHDTDDSLNRSIRRTLRWHHLLRGGSADRLSVEEQRGLIGELSFLSLFSDLVGESAAIEAWKGPEGASKDFEVFGACIEVKARRGAARPYVQISSEDQLADVPGAMVFLRVYDVDAAVRPDGQTLTDHVKAIDDRFRAADLASYQLWETALISAGFDWDDDYSDRRWQVGKVTTFEVTDGFPRISAPVPTGVINVKFAVSLDACAPFQAQEQEFADTLVQLNTSTATPKETDVGT